MESLKVFVVRFDEHPDFVAVYDTWQDAKRHITTCDELSEPEEAEEVVSDDTPDGRCRIAALPLNSRFSNDGLCRIVHGVPTY